MLHALAGTVSTGLACKIFLAGYQLGNTQGTAAIGCAVVLGLIGLIQLTGRARALERRYIG